jgi:hypothetical protein
MFTKPSGRWIAPARGMTPVIDPVPSALERDSRRRDPLSARPIDRDGEETAIAIADRHDSLPAGFGKAWPFVLLVRTGAPDPGVGSRREQEGRHLACAAGGAEDGSGSVAAPWCHDAGPRVPADPVTSEALRQLKDPSEPDASLMPFLARGFEGSPISDQAMEHWLMNRGRRRQVSGLP